MMKTEMTSFDIMVMTAELQRLVGNYVDKVYQPEPNRLHIRFNIPGAGKENLIIETGKWLYLDSGAELPGDTLSFGMFLRKYIINGRVVRVSQRKFDRIVELAIDRRGEFLLVLEMFGKGNAILIKDGMILQPLHSKSWSERELRAHKEYGFPPERIDAPRLSKEEMRSIITSSEKDLVRTLAIDLNLGGVYAEELCMRVGAAKNILAKDLSREVVDSLLSALEIMLGEISSPQPMVVFRDSEPIDVVPIGLQQYEECHQEEYGSLSDAISAYLGTKPKEEPEDERAARLERRRKQQEEALEKHIAEATEYHHTADFIYTHYELVNRALETLRAEETPIGFGIISKDPKRKTAIIESEGREIELYLNEDLNASAQRYYEREKKAKAKIESLQTRLEETQKEMKQADKRMTKQEARRREPTKQFWIDRFRWFLSSEGFLVVGGRDAKSNESIVKKHLEPGDRYVHADMSGAPSVIVKEGSAAGEVTLEEACQFAASFSKAWSKGLASGSAYWVNPEQVSKQAETGEYLPKGSFMIRGKRNYSQKLRLEVAIGEVTYEGAKKIMCGPPRAVSRHSETAFHFVPGRGNPNEIAKELSAHYNVPVEEILKILPPGGLDKAVGRKA